MRRKATINLTRRLVLTSAACTVPGAWTGGYAAHHRADGNVQHTITVPVAVFVLDATSQSTRLSSQRSVETVDRHFALVNRIWSQAHIEIRPTKVQRIRVPDQHLNGLIRRRGRGGINSFFNAIAQGEINIGSVSRQPVISVFFVRTLGGINGMSATGRNAVFVVDNPSNTDFRVTAHEIGHVLGLYHNSTDINRLLFSGSDGILLTIDEQIVARYNAYRWFLQSP